MNIYIPKHLRKLEVIDNLCKLIGGYREETLGSTNTDNSSKSIELDYYFNKYKTLSYDPVKKFVGICITNNNDTQDNDFLTEKINYITEIFYNLSGSYKIFHMLEVLLGFKMVVDYQINLGYLKITIDSDTYNNIFGLNEDLYQNSFINFLNALLFFKKIDIIYDKIEMILEKTENIVTRIEEPLLYSYFNIEPITAE